MRKVICVLTAISILSLCGCSGNTEISDSYSDIEDCFIYENIDYNFSEAMTAGEGAELYIAGYNETGLSVFRYDDEGNIISEFPASCDSIYDIYFNDNTIYIAYPDINGSSVDKIDVISGKTEFVCNFPCLSDIRSVSVLNNEIIAIGTDINAENEQCGYVYNYIEIQSRNRGIYLCKDGEIEKLTTDTPFEAESFGNVLVVYGCDSENGFYFKSYSDGKLSEPYYNNQLGNIKALSLFGETGYITSSQSRFNQQTIVAGNISENSATEIMSDVYIFGDVRQEITSNSNFCWYLNDNDKKLTRVKLSAYYKGNSTITLLCSNHSNVPPFSCGYNIEIVREGNEETALKILSQDKNYDICYLNSRDTIAGNIRDKGSFYPLNDVDGISEYMDSLFPYIKDTCINDNGEIWCVPVSADVAFLTYNDEKCKALGFDMSDLTLEEYLDFVDKIKSEGLQKYCGYNSYLYCESYLLNYLSENSSFNTSEFITMAEMLRQRFPYNYNGLNINNMDSDVYFAVAYENKTDEYISEATQYLIGGSQFMCNNTLRAAALPYEDNTSAVNLVYLCVNPFSDNLNDALEYITTLCEYTSAQENVFVFKDRAKYSDTVFSSDMYEIFNNGKIGFAYEEEIYKTDFESYLLGEITIDDFITEADRKLSAYINE